METIEIDIINPKAEKLLKDLAELNLISIRRLSDDGFLKILKKFRKKAEKDGITLDIITKEIELVRMARYEEKKI